MVKLARGRAGEKETGIEMGASTLSQCSSRSSSLNAWYRIWREDKAKKEAGEVSKAPQKC
eukprot:1157721-Pelagomonas_calceolata.AAC.4